LSFRTNYPSPWQCYRHQHKQKKDQDVSSYSTLEDSTCSSSRSDSPEPKHQRQGKKRSCHMLLREIRRLRGENISLRTSVSMLKNDLHNITLSRQDTDASHKRSFEQYVDKNARLEIEILDRDDEIEALKKQIGELKLAAKEQTSLTLHDAAYFKRNSNVFGCYEYEENDDNLDCQPVAHDSALPELNVKMDELKIENRLMDQEDDDSEEEEEEEEQEPFDHVAMSYIHQAMLSKLSSARVRLELDDLICKYEPTSDTITSVLANAFVSWICSLLAKFVDKTASATKVFTTRIQTGIVEFWESILQHYTPDDESQLQLLNHIEDELNHVESGKAIADHFDRLILMLYKYDVVDDEAVVSWWQKPFDNEVSKKIRKITTRFVEWVQHEDDDEGDDDDDDDDEDDEEDEDSDDDEVFSFVESPIPEEQEMEDENQDNLPNNNNSMIDDLLTNQHREYCVCQLDNDTTTTQNNKQEDECSCSTYTPPPVIEKKKKSVRIAM
jgi:hypothetical protein